MMIFQLPTQSPHAPALTGVEVCFAKQVRQFRPHRAKAIGRSWISFANVAMPVFGDFVALGCFFPIESCHGEVFQVKPRRFLTTSRVPGLKLMDLL